MDQIESECYDRANHDGKFQEITQHGNADQTNAQEAGHDDEAGDSPADADPVHGYAIVQIIVLHGATSPPSL
jgi:hypothetical protein